MFDPTTEAINNAHSIVSSIFDLTPGVSLARIKDAFLHKRFLDVAAFDSNDEIEFQQSLKALTVSLCRQMAAQMVECGAHNVVFALKDVRREITNELVDQSIARMSLSTQSASVAELSQQFLMQPALSSIVMPETSDTITFWKSVQEQFDAFKMQSSYNNNPVPTLSALQLLESSFALRCVSISTDSFRPVEPVLNQPSYTAGYAQLPGAAELPIAA